MPKAYEELEVLDTCKHSNAGEIQQTYFKEGNWSIKSGDEKAWYLTNNNGAEFWSTPSTGSWWNKTKYKGVHAVGVTRITGTTWYLSANFCKLLLCYEDSKKNGYVAKFYYKSETEANVKIYKLVSGTETELGSSTGSFKLAAGQKFIFYKNGKTLEVLMYDGSYHSIRTQEDTEELYSEGYIGVDGKGEETQWENWSVKEVAEEKKLSGSSAVKFVSKATLSFEKIGLLAGVSAIKFVDKATLSFEKILPEGFTLLDSLKHESVHWCEEGNWTVMKWAKESANFITPTTTTSGTELAGFEKICGSFWNAKEFGSGNAISITSDRGTSSTGRSWDLWICYNNTSHSGYRAHFVKESEEKVYVIIYKVVEGVETELAKSSSVIDKAKNEYSFGREYGELKAWYRIEGSGAWIELAAKADSKYTKGNVGFGGADTAPYFYNFNSVEREEKESKFISGSSLIKFTSKDSLSSVANLVPSIKTKFTDSSNLIANATSKASSNIIFSDSTKLSSHAEISGSTTLKFYDSSYLYNIASLYGSTTTKFTDSSNLSANIGAKATSNIIFSDISSLSANISTRATSNIIFSDVFSLVANAITKAKTTVKFSSVPILSAHVLFSGSTTVKFSSIPILSAHVIFSGSTTVKFYESTIIFWEIGELTAYLRGSTTLKFVSHSKLDAHAGIDGLTAISFFSTAPLFPRWGIKGSSVFKFVTADALAAQSRVSAHTQTTFALKGAESAQAAAKGTSAVVLADKAKLGARAIMSGNTRMKFSVSAGKAIVQAALKAVSNITFSDSLSTIRQIVLSGITRIKFANLLKLFPKYTKPAIPIPIQVIEPSASKISVTDLQTYVFVVDKQEYKVAVTSSPTEKITVKEAPKVYNIYAEES